MSSSALGKKGKKYILRSGLRLQVAFLEVPYGMIVSADRSGVIFIYQ